MKSIKPGRGPSFQNGIGNLFAIAFGILWTLLAINSGAPIFFSLFGVLFITMAAVNAIYHFRNATKKERDSLFDITDEMDPAHTEMPSSWTNAQEVFHYCPYCGTKLMEGSSYCQNCGRRLNQDH